MKRQDGIDLLMRKLHMRGSSASHCEKIFAN
jgi:hypothetical protein